MLNANVIASRENQKLKYARKLRAGKINDAVFVEGVRQCEEALRSNQRIVECFIDENFGSSERAALILRKISEKKGIISKVDQKIFHTLADTKNSQGIILIIEKPKTDKGNFEQKLALKPIQLVIYLSEINNPSNLGAILRTAEAAGVSGLIVSNESSDAFSPKATRSALGANLRLPIWEKVGFTQVLSWAKDKKLVTTAADTGGAKIYSEIDWKTPRLLIFGSEAHGLSDAEKREIEDIIFIPMENNVESLNLAVSCGVILFEAGRQRKAF